MSVDKLVDSTLLDANLTSVANAIRTKGGTSAQMAFPTGFVSAVQAIPTGVTPTGTKQINIAQNGTTIEDVAAYANAEITVNVQSGGGLANVDGGTFTAATETQTFSVPVTAQRSHIVFITVNTLEDMIMANGSLTLVIASGDSNNYQYTGTARSTDRVLTLARFNNDWRGQITFGASTISGTFMGNGAKASFPAGQTYQWFAW